MIPDLLTNGLLPPGIHDAVLKEVVSRYGLNPHRRRLLTGLERAIASLQAAGCKRVFLDGSFVTSKEFPGDYDACWDTTGVDLAQLDPVLLDFTNSRAAQKVKFFGELFPAASAARMKPLTTFLSFFQTDKDSGEQKGIIAISL